jgi:4-hydroxy-3-methylbut-2-en-1-yl diphosphate synthase IspG/GcpE
MSSPDQLRPKRRPTVSVDVGGVLVGSAHPVVVQSMTNTDTADADATAIQVARLAQKSATLRITGQPYSLSQPRSCVASQYCHCAIAISALTWISRSPST